MISIKMFCEATAAELHDPAVRWDYYPISYLRSYRRCKEFKSKIPLLADLDWGESNMKFLITSMPLDIILLFLKEFNSRLDFYDHFGEYIYSDDNFVIRTFDPVKLLQILSHGFPVDYIDWAEIPFDHPSLIFVLEKYIRDSCLWIGNRSEITSFANNILERLRCIRVDENGYDNLYGLEYSKLFIDLDKYFIANILNYLGEEYPIFRSRELKFFDSSAITGPRIISFNIFEGEASGYYHFLHPLLERDWIVDPISFTSQRECFGQGSMYIFKCLNILKKYNLMYVFEEQPLLTKSPIIKYILEGGPGKYESELELDIFCHPAECAFSAANDRKVNPAKYELWRKYREKFFSDKK